jgi:hypothetical protein
MELAEWGMLVGDAIHNLRAALDNLVWALSVQRKRPPAKIPENSRWRHVRFPIRTHDRGYSGPDGYEGRLLWAVDPVLWARFKELQPFERRKADPTHDPLWVLEELWNIDKHRYTLAASPWVKVRTGRRGPSHYLRPKLLDRHRDGPAKTGTELAIVRVRGVPVSDEALEAYMGMYLKISYGIALGRGSPAEGGEVRGTLNGLVDAVLTVLGKFEAEVR